MNGGSKIKELCIDFPNLKLGEKEIRLLLIICNLLKIKHKLDSKEYIELTKIAIDQLNNLQFHHIDYFVSISPYDKINYKLQQENPPTKLVFIKSKTCYNLQIRVDYYSQEQLITPIITQQILQVLFQTTLSEKWASNIACSIIWGILEKKRQNAFYQFWTELHSHPITDYNYKTYVKSIYNIQPHKIYSKLLSTVISKIQAGSKLQSKECFLLPKVLELKLDEFRQVDIKILATAVNANTVVKGEILKKVPYSRSLALNSLNALLQSYILQKRVFYFPQSIGLNNYYLIFRVPRTEIAFPNVFSEYPLVRAINSFVDYDTTYYVNFYAVDNYYSNKQMQKWIQELYLESNDAVTITAPLILGKEDPEYRHTVQNPEFYDAETSKWVLADFDTVSTKKFEKNNIPKLAPLDQLQQKILLAMIEKPFTKQEIYDKIGGNRNKVFTAINELMTKKIVEQRFAISFFNDLSTILFIYDGEETVYTEFIEQIATKMPIAVSYRLQNLLENNSAYFGFSFLNIPEEYITQIIQKAQQIDPAVKIFRHPLVMDNLSKLRIKPKESGWRYQKLPELHFKLIKNALQ